MAKETADTARIFLSYSRADSAFMHRLATELAARGYDTDYDRSTSDPDKGISAEEDWWQRLQEMIVKADVVVFIVTPDSAASKVCADEISFTVGLGKRLIPILRRQIDFKRVPKALSARNIAINFEDDSITSFATAIGELCSEIDKDITWHREISRLTALAKRWELLGQQDEHLLSAADVRELGNRLENRPANALEPAAILKEIREKSREKHDENQKRQRRIVGRAFVHPADAAIDDQEFEHALRLTAAGAILADDLDFDPDIGTQLWRPAVRAISKNRTLCTLAGHQGGVEFATFDTSGDYIATASSDGTARIWDSTTGRHLATTKARLAKVNYANFDWASARLVTACEDGNAQIWDAADGRIIFELRGHQASVNCACFSPDDNFIATSSDDNTIRLWDCLSGEQKLVLYGHEKPVKTVEFNREGDVLLTSSFDTTARMWDVSSGREKSCLRGHSGFVTSASFSADGATIVTASTDGTVRQWAAANGQQLNSFSAHAGFSPLTARGVDGFSRIITASGDQTARLWDSHDGREIAVLKGHRSFLNSVTFSPDFRRAVTASHDGTARVWRIETSQEIGRLVGHNEFVSSACFSPDGSKILTSSTDRSIRIWDAATCRADKEVTDFGAELIDAQYSSSGKTIVVGSKNWRLLILDSTNTCVLEQFRSQPFGIASLAVSRSGDRFLTVSRSSVMEIWQTGHVDAIATVHTSGFSINRAAFHPDKPLIVAACGDNIIRFWCFRLGWSSALCEGHVGPVRSVSFNRDGTKVISASADSTARVWDVATGLEVVRLIGHRLPVNDATISNDGSLIVTASEDRTVRIWDATTGVEVEQLVGHDNIVTTAGFNPAGDRVVTSSYDCTARIWDVSRSKTIVNNRHLIIGAALAYGIGKMTEPETKDLLMEAAPPDLFDVAIKMITMNCDLRDVLELADQIRVPASTNSYLAPSAFASHFGQPKNQLPKLPDGRLRFDTPEY